MKKIVALILALTLALSMTVFVSAADEIEIPLDADHVGESSAGRSEILTLGEGTITGDEIALFSLYLPENVDLGETVVLHIKGSSAADFRVWLLADGESEEKGVEITFSNQWKASENGFTEGEFEKYIELTAEDYDQQNMTSANRLCFKGSSYGVNLSQLTITYVGVIYGTMADVEGNAAEEAKPFADAAAAALESAKSATDTAGVEAALADAQAAVDSLTEKASLGFPSVNELLKGAKDAVKEIEGMISAAAAEEVLGSIQGDIDAVNNALTTAQGAAANDVDTVSAALADAQAAAAKIEEAAAANNYDDVTAASRDAKSAVKEIESILKDAEATKQAEEEAARKAEEEAAAKKKQTTTIVIIVVAVVVAVVVIAAVVAAVLKKKKK